MRKALLLCVLAASAALATQQPASAAGGMGDPSVLLKQKNAICDMQRRGIGPLSPDLCLPELPADPTWQDQPRHRS